MSRIHLNRDRQSLGQFTPEEVAEGLRSGRFLPTDLAWREGMETWQPLSTFTDLPEPDEVQSPTLAPGTPISEIAKAPLSPAWERTEGTLPGRAFETIRDVLGSPQNAFAGMPLTGGFSRPLAFLLVVGTLCSIVAIVYRVVFQQMMPHQEMPAHITPGVMVSIYVGLAILMPFFITLGSFLSGGLMHLSLMLVGASPKSFEATYRVVCYVNGATSVMLLLPFCGGLIQGVWNIYALTIGFREVHGTTTGKAVVAVLLPMAVCCGLVFATLAAGGAFAAFSSQVGK
jgi:hypothetical protein